MVKTSWIKCYRSLMDSEIWADEWLVKLWLWCLFKANHKPQTFRGVAIARGQFVTGRHTAADELGVSPSKWYRGIERLVGLGCIETIANKHWTTVTVCNYATYQDSVAGERTTDEQQMDNKWTTDEQQMNNQRTQEKELQNDRMTEGIQTHARAAEAGRLLKTWSLPPAIAEMPGVADAVDRWQRWVSCNDASGRPWDQSRLDTAILNKLSEGWDADKIIRSIAKSIEWGAKTWRDPDNDYDSPRRANTKPSKYRELAPGEVPF